MPKKISINQMREWLKLYDGGRSEADIAKDAHRDVRTVKRSIEQARRELNAQTARADLLKEALRNHHNALLNTLRELKDDIRIPPLDIDVPCLEDVGLETELTATWPEEKRTLLELLREHLKRDPLWDVLERWRKLLAGHLQARVALKCKAAKLLQEKTGLKLSDKPIKGPFLYSDAAPYIVYRETLIKALASGRSKDIEDNVNISPEGKVRYGAGTLLAEPSGMEEECKRGILNAFSELWASPERERAVVTCREAETQAANVKKSMDEISMLGLVPGTCRICRRLGI